MLRKRLNAALKKADPLYWCAPNGESVAHVAENRVRNVLDTLHRECREKKVVCVTHGEAIQAFCLVLERMSDEAFKIWEKGHIHNCETFWFTRNDPETGEQARRLTWVKRAWPTLDGATWVMEELPWRKLEFHTYSNEELLAQVARVPQLLAPAAERLISG